MKETYLFQKLLKEICGLKAKAGSLQRVELSEKGKERAEKHYRKRRPVKSLSPDSRPLEGKRKEYVQFQKEVAASRHIPAKSPPKPPGRILKLPKPLGRK